MNGDLERETYIGHKAQYMRGVLTLKHPIKNGIIRNWDEMEKVSVSKSNTDLKSDVLFTEFVSWEHHL